MPAGSLEPSIHTLPPPFLPKIHIVLYTLVLLVCLSLAFPKTRHWRNFFLNKRCHEAHPRVQKAGMSSRGYRQPPKAPDDWNYTLSCNSLANSWPCPWFYIKEVYYHISLQSKEAAISDLKKIKIFKFSNIQIKALSSFCDRAPIPLPKSPRHLRRAGPGAGVLPWVSVTSLQLPPRQCCQHPAGCSCTPRGSEAPHTEN